MSLLSSVISRMIDNVNSLNLDLPLSRCHNFVANAVKSRQSVSDKVFFFRDVDNRSFHSVLVDYNYNVVADSYRQYGGYFDKCKNAYYLKGKELPLLQTIPAYKLL